VRWIIDWCFINKDEVLISTASTNKETGCALASRYYAREKLNILDDVDFAEKCR
jgi:hypothetical protein